LNPRKGSKKIKLMLSIWKGLSMMLGESGKMDCLMALGGLCIKMGVFIQGISRKEFPMAREGL
jgi:hypothetical protein